MDKRKISSDKNTSSAKKKMLFIMLEQKLDVNEHHERGYKLKLSLYSPL
jgi:hypothetical protein